MNIMYKVFKEGEESTVNELITRVFDKYVGIDILRRVGR